MATTLARHAARLAGRNGTVALRHDAIGRCSTRQLCHLANLKQDSRANGAHVMVGGRISAIVQSTWQQHGQRRSISHRHPSSGRKKAEEDAEEELDFPENEKYKLDSEGRIILYRGPAAMKPWIYYFMGLTFIVVGVEAAYNLYHHFSFPSIFKRTSDSDDDKPALADKKQRIIVAGLSGTVGVVTGCLFFMVPSATVTRLSLDLPNRKLVIRTAARGFSALLPRAIYPAPLRRTAEVHGYYLTPLNNERSVPLTNVFRIRGSAVGAYGQPSVTLRPVGAASTISTKSTAVEEKRRRDRSAAAAQRHREEMLQVVKRSIEIRTGQDRFWYTLEASGGTAPGADKTLNAFRRLLQRVSHSLRGTTDWRDVIDPPTRLPRSNPAFVDAKQPWFLSRRTFDDVIPLIKRK